MMPLWRKGYMNGLPGTSVSIVTVICTMYCDHMIWSMITWCYNADHMKERVWIWSTWHIDVYLPPLDPEHWFPPLTLLLLQLLACSITFIDCHRRCHIYQSSLLQDSATLIPMIQQPRWHQSNDAWCSMFCHPLTDSCSELLTIWFAAVDICWKSMAIVSEHIVQNGVGTVQS